MRINGLTTLLIINKGKLPCYLKSGMQLANANEVDSELLNITSQAPDPTPSSENGMRPPEISKVQLPNTLDEAMELTFPLKIEGTGEQEILPAKEYRLWTITSLPSSNICSNERVQWQQQQLRETFIESKRQISEEESSHLDNLLAEYHNIFSLEDERGETDLVEFKMHAPKDKQLGESHLQLDKR